MTQEKIPADAISWPFLFQGWDSILYVGIARSGYYFPLYAFFPAFPALIKAVGYIVGDLWTASALLSVVLGLAWVPVFHKMAEQYLTTRDAFEATVLAATFPYVFLFTSLAYTEGLFILATVSAWYLHLRKKHIAAGFVAALSALTRPYGILILLPMIIRNARKISSRIMISYLIPIISVFAWVIYLKLETGSWLIIFDAEKHWMEHTGKPLWVWISSLFAVQSTALSPINTFVVGFTVIAAFLVSTTWKIDRNLTIYSWLLFLLFIVFGYSWSLTRFLSFIFPAWLMMRAGSRVALALLICFFTIASVLIWFMFLTGVWIG